MHRYADRARSLLLAGALTAAVGLAASGPAQAAAPPGTGPVVVNPSGAAVTVWSVQTPQNTFAVDASSSPNQVTWTTPVTLDQGVEPKVALTTDGHAIAVWQALNGTTALGIHAAVRTPAGTWSAPADVAPTGQNPLIGIDSAGDAIAVWTSTSAGIQTSTLPVGGRWSAPVTLSTITGATPAIAVAPNGTALIAWGPSNGYVQASAGSITGPWSTPATISLKLYHMRGLKVTLNSSGQGSASWSYNDGILQTVTLSDGIWSTP